MIFARGQAGNSRGSSVTYRRKEFFFFLNTETDFWWRRTLGSHSLQRGKERRRNGKISWKASKTENSGKTLKDQFLGNTDW